MIRTLGVLSDTHSRFDTAAVAVQRLIDTGVDALVHCGDVGTGIEGRRVLEALVTSVPTWFVWGNTDYDSDELTPYALSLGLHVLNHWGHLPVSELAESIPVAVHHGHDNRRYQQIIDEQDGGFLLSGHTHIPHDRTESGVRLLNPGALYRAQPKTFATLDLVSGEWTLQRL